MLPPLPETGLGALIDLVFSKWVLRIQLRAPEIEDVGGSKWF